jgi:hypothetical protein
VQVRLEPQGKQMTVTGRRRVDELLTDDDVVEDDDAVELRAVISGGRR